MEELKTKIPYKLQFFAEGEEPEQNQEPDPNAGATNNEGEEPELSVEEQLQKARVEMAKMKKAVDKAANEAATYKKQLREKQSTDEIALQEKAEKEAEREEKYNQLVKENSINKLEKSFLALGYPVDKAKEAAEAQYENDTDALFKIQSEHQASLVKQAEAEWLKSRPAPQGGNDDENVKDPFLEGFNSL